MMWEVDQKMQQEEAWVMMSFRWNFATVVVCLCLCLPNSELPHTSSGAVHVPTLTLVPPPVGVPVVEEQMVWSEGWDSWQSNAPHNDHKSSNRTGWWNTHNNNMTRAVRLGDDRWKVGRGARLRRLGAAAIAMTCPPYAAGPRAGWGWAREAKSASVDSLSQNGLSQNGYGQLSVLNKY